MGDEPFRDTPERAMNYIFCMIRKMAGKIFSEPVRE
jgi:hypothetical protein